MNNRIAEIRERLEKASKGQWYWETDDNEEETLWRVIKPGMSSSVLTLDSEDYCREEDKEFIAHAPEDIRFLLGQVEKLQTEIVKERWGDICKLREENQRLREELGKVQQQSMAYFEIANNALRGGK